LEEFSLNNKGQFSIIAALLVAVILITTVIVTYSTIRSSPVRNQPPILNAIDETNLAIKQILGFTVGYYDSVLQVTGNVSYAKTQATSYLQSGLLNIANMHPEWGTSLNLSSSALQAYWFSSTSYSSGNLTVNYDLPGLGILGVCYQTSCQLSVQTINITTGQACVSVTQDQNQPLVTLGKQNFNFYHYNNANLAWELLNPPAGPTAYSNGTYYVNVPSGINPYSYVVQVQDQRGIITVASSFNSYNVALTWNSTSVNSAQTLYAHQEMTTIGGISYYLLKNCSADASGTTLSASTGSTGRILMGKVVYPLTGISSIPASTWTTYYRGYTTASSATAHASVDILIRASNGTVRQTVAQDVANSSNFGGSWSTLSGTYSWSNYTVVDQTDYLEIDYYVDVTLAGVGTVYLRIDDANLSQSNQTRTTNVLLQVDLYSLFRQGTAVVELLQDGTMRWLGQNLVLTNSNSTLPFPPVPVKSIHVNETINGVNGEVPFQIEDWSSAYHVPLGLTSNMSIFSGRTMLVFLATPNTSKVTIWWNGSDMATQTPFAYTNRYFTDSPSSGILSNGLATLQFQGTFEPVTFKVGTSSSTANFMRINNENSIYGSYSSYVIANGTVRDIVHQEAEWSNGVTNPNCSDVYADIVLTLPANATYYTYQLSLMFVQSQHNRTINDLCPVWLTSLTGQVQTENGTANGLPIVSNATDLFYNYSASTWAHHWSQIVSGTAGAGIMFTDSANQYLYIFDSITGTKTGGVNTSSTGTIQLSPVAKSQLNFNTTLDSRMQDMIWCGAIATFNTATTSVYNNTDQTGLWIIVEYPPKVAVTGQNY
jgi:hypothetical protein